MAPAVAVWNKDPFMKIKEKIVFPTMQLESVPHSEEEEEDEEEISITRPRSGRTIRPFSNICSTPKGERCGSILEKAK